MITAIPGGVTAAQGFSAAAIHAGVKASSDPAKDDLMLLVSECDAAAAAVYTTNRVKAAPLYVTMDHLRDGYARGVVANSGNANACCANSHENAEEMCAAAAAATGLEAKQFVVASTGVIGQELNIGVITAAMPALAEKLASDAAASAAAAHAIMTTDTVPKEYAVRFEIQGHPVTIGAIAKGSGMIHPNMGTTLSFLTTDCAIVPALLHEALLETVQVTLNRVSIDGDTSTNDTCCILANGRAGNPLIDWKTEDYDLFREALKDVLTWLARHIAADGEGATRLLTCTVHGARSEESAEKLAKAVIQSSLVKAAMFGADANFGRVICAMGYSHAPFRPEYVDIRYRSCAGEILLCKSGEGLNFDEELAKEIISQDEVIVDIDLHEGGSAATCWGCDLTYDYVKINGDYRT